MKSIRKSPIINEFSAYYRQAHSVKNLAGRVLQGNAKKFFLEEIAYIISTGKISANFESEIKDFCAFQQRKADEVADKSLSLQRLKTLSEAQKKELIKILSTELLGL